MRYRPASPWGAIGACLLSLIATFGGIMAPENLEVFWISLFASAALIFVLSVASPAPERGHGDE